MPDFGPSHGYPGGSAVPGVVLDCDPLKRWMKKKIDEKKDDKPCEKNCDVKKLDIYEPAVNTVGTVVLIYVSWKVIKTCGLTIGGLTLGPPGAIAGFTIGLATP